MHSQLESDLLQGDDQAFWYSLVAAAPVPETGECVNVAVLFGNGRATHLRYLDSLPRLAGLAAADEINVFQTMLQSVAETVNGRGVDVEQVRAMIAPQLSVHPPRRLFQAVTESLVERIAVRYLSTPKAPAREANLEAIVRRSLAKLDDEIGQVRRPGLLVYENVRPKTLYPGRLDRIVGYRVPRLARALRSMGPRDVLVDSLVVDEGQDRGDTHKAVGRISQAFFAYDTQLRRHIRQFAGREIRLVGILQPGISGESPDTRALRDFIKDEWSHHAEVVDGNEKNIPVELGKFVDWVLEGPK